MAMHVEEGVKAISKAVAGGDVEEVSRLLDDGPHLLEARNPRRGHRTPLMVAAQEGQEAVVRLLLKRQAEVNASNPGGVTVLHLAAAGGHEKVVSLLLRSGADSSRTCQGGSTALMNASWAGHLGVVQQLLRHMRGRGVDFRAKDGCTALWDACRNGRVDIVRALLLAGASHMVTSNGGQTPRQIAEAGGYSECVALLEWWEGELERAYSLYRARCLSEIAQTPTAVYKKSIPKYLAQRRGPAPRGQVVSPPKGVNWSIGKGEEDEQNGQGARRVEAPEEKHANIKYVTQNLPRELFIELIQGFHH